MRSILVGLVCLLLSQGSRVWTIQELFQRNVGNAAQQNTAFPPHRIVGNIYYVGTESLSSFLVTTPAGHIVINSNYERNVPVIRESMAKLGFTFEDVKIVLGSHAHGDHMQGDAAIVASTKARAMAMAEDVPTLERMASPAGHPRVTYEPLHDGSEVALGGVKLVAHHTPGHTPGCTTWTMRVLEGGRPYDVVIIGSVGVNPGTNLVGNAALVAQYQQSFKTLRSLHVDVPLGSHPGMYEMAAKHARLGGSVNPFVDPLGYAEEIDIQEGAFNGELKRQQVEGPPAGRGRGAAPAAAQDANLGKAAFEARCARCHGGDGSGGPMGPSIVFRLTTRDDAQMATLIRTGFPDGGMPGQPLPDAEATALVSFLRTIQRQPAGAVSKSFQTVSGGRIEGHVLGEGLNDLQVRTADQRIHLLRRSGDRVREVGAGSDWPSYNGDPRGNRYTTATQIDKATVTKLAPQWMFPIPNAQSLQGTPVVAGGVMYVTSTNQVFALDAGSGRQIWRYQRARATVAPASGMANRGVGVAGDRVFLETDNAHVIALNRFTGSLLWETALADVRQNYSASTAPLPVGDLLIAGVSGGEHGANGFVAALDQTTGKEVWRFNTVPKRGEPGSETWQGKDIDHGGAPTWFTGSYDPDLDTVYWPVGNPSKEYNGDDRHGDNLYANSLLALDRKTGALKWHYQFTPHDLWDWDATQTSVLIDAPWIGQPRKLLLHASRNGFFYVFDRVNGALLLAKPFVRNLTWAKEIDAKGRPVLLPGQEPSPQGTKVCPSQDGATNWFSPSYNPATGLYYVQTFEKCSIYTKSDGGEWEAGKSYLGGVQRTSADPVPQRVLKAIDIRTGAIRWELPQPGPAVSWGGTLSTATGLVFAGEEGGALIAVDAVTGKTLWSFPTNQNWKASPMTYLFDGKQYVAAIAGGTVLAFGIQ